MKVLLALNPVLSFCLFVICCIMFLSHLGWWFLSSLKVGTKSLSIPVSSPYPNVVLGIENIPNKYFPNDSLFSGLRQTHGCNK